MAESTDIETPQGQLRQELNSRMIALLEAPPFEPEPEPNSDDHHQILIPIDEDDDNGDDRYYLMDADLYISAKQDEGLAFLNVLERVSRSNKVHINRLFIAVSLAGDTLLHVAASNGNADIVDLIITHFPSLLNDVNCIGDTAVHVAAKAGELSVLRVINRKRKEFLNSGSLIFCGLTNTKVEWKDNSLKATNKEGNTPLHEALINRHANLAIELVEEDVSVSAVPNIEDKSAFYLAAEARNSVCLQLMMEYVTHEGINLRQVGKSPIHAAILGGDIVVLSIMLGEQPGLINLGDDERRTPLHFAALMGCYNYLICYLIDWNHRNVIKRDKDGQLPIHLASMNGHIDVIERLLEQHYNPAHELLNGKGQNILHVAAECGKYEVVNYILKLKLKHRQELKNQKDHDGKGQNILHVAAECGKYVVNYILKLKLKHRQELNQLINQKDHDGNTPLHLATMKFHPKIVSALTLDDRVVLDSSNNDNLTALDAAQHDMDEIPTFRQQLTWLSLIASGTSRYSSSNQSMTFNIDKNTNKRPRSASSVDPKSPAMNYKDWVGTLLLVSTLIATVTFAAGFTMPGGYNDSEPNVGIATMVKHSMFLLFVFGDTLAMFISLIVVVLLIWAQVGDISLRGTILKLAVPLLGIALTTMSLAFIAGVYLTVSTLKWLANGISILALILLIVVLVLFLALVFPFASRYRVFRYITFYFICVVAR